MGDPAAIGIGSLTEVLALIAAAAEGDLPAADIAVRTAPAARTALGASAVGVYLATGSDRRPRLHAVVGRPAGATPSELDREVRDDDWGLVVAMRAGGTSVGLLAVDWPEGRGDGADRVHAEGIAGLLAAAVHNARLLAGLGERSRELERQMRELAGLAEIAGAPGRGGGDGDVAAEVARGLLNGLGASAVRIAGPDGRAIAAAGEAGRLDAEPGTGPPGEARALDLGDDGSTLHLRWDRSAGPLPDGAHVEAMAAQATVALMNDRLVEALRAEQRERQAAARALARSQDDERRRIADEIHDGPIQELAGLSLMLDGLAADGGGDVATARAAAAAARAAIGGLREAIFRLHPIVVAELGLGAAARRVVGRLREAGLIVTADLDAAGALGEEGQTVAFRVLQESAANIIKHSRAARVDISLTSDEAGFVLSVTDDGRGIDVSRLGDVLAEGHLGVAAMRLRAELAGGGLEIRRRAEGGTRVRLALPRPGPGAPSRG